MSIIDLCSRDFKPSQSRYSCIPSHHISSDGSVVLFADSKFLKLKTFNENAVPTTFDLRNGMPFVHDQ